jgi:predicted MFS family arabinose efflux permease
VENRAAEPMVAVSLFRERVFTGGTIAVLMWGFGLFGIYFFTSLYLQNVLGFSPTEAGAAFVPMALLMAVGAIVSEKAASKIGGANLVGFAMLLMAVGIASVSLLGRHASYLDLMPSFAVIGIGGGLSVTLTAMVLGAMPESEAGVASGIFNASREVAGLLGITVIGAILTARQSAAAHAGHDAVDSFLSGYRAGLLVAAVLVAAGGAAAFIALRGARTASKLTADEAEVAELELAG